jgi:hypothetical protein
LSLYAAVKVPEVWLHDGRSHQFLIRNRHGKYAESQHSLAFPFLAPADFDKYLRQHATMDETSLTHQFVAWARACKERWQHEKTRPRSKQVKSRKR